MPYDLGMSKKQDRLEVRLNYAERLAWEEDAQRRGMSLSQWVRSACATFVTCGKRTVLVPAAPEPEYVDDLRREVAEVKRLQEELARRQADLETAVRE